MILSYYLGLFCVLRFTKAKLLEIKRFCIILGQIETPGGTVKRFCLQTP